MMQLRWLLSIICMSVGMMAWAEPDFTPQQRAWFMRVVDKTDLLRSSMGSCIAFNRDSFYRVVNGELAFDYQKAEDYFVIHPDSLMIDWECIALQPSGLLAEAAVKLSLWELVWELNEARYHSTLRTPSWLALKNELSVRLPEKQRNKPNSKSSLRILNVVMHPSLPLKIKRQQLTDLKLTAYEQKKMMEAWSSSIEKYIASQSRQYFRQLINGTDDYVFGMTASGEGSGTAGLLYEYDSHPADTTKAGYGKGCGLFTYQYDVVQAEMVPKAQTEMSLMLPSQGLQAIHCSLWGIDNSQSKPMIVLTANNKSYHLFGSSAGLSPDSVGRDGVSHFDRIRQMMEQKINKPIKKMEREGGLSDLLKKEFDQKENIEKQLHQLESEIDSLQRLKPPGLREIDAKRQQINVLLGSLSARERRITELGRKIASQTEKINQSRSVIAEMEKLLGPNPQSWQLINGQYQFVDGVVFNSTNQDLVMQIDSAPQEVSIRLISAAITLQGKSRDEVQLLACAVKTLPIVAEAIVVENLTSRCFDFYYHPDEIISHTSLDSLVAFITQTRLSVDTIEVRTVVSSGKGAMYPNRQRELESPLTEFGQMRHSRVVIETVAGGIRVVIVSGTDPVPTRLSRVTSNQRRELGIIRSSIQNNEILAQLRGDYLKREILLRMGLPPFKVE
jgi:hypothetical protein